jgi:elongation factor 2 kinase
MIHLKIHFELCKYHQIGRFIQNCDKDDLDESIDKEAAFFHLKQAAHLGVTEAVVNLAKIYLQLPHDILSFYKVDETDDNMNIGFSYMLISAQKGDISSIYYIAKAYDTGLGLPKNR